MAKRRTKLPKTPPLQDQPLVKRDALGRVMKGSALGAARGANRINRLIEHIAVRTNDGRMAIDELCGIAQKPTARDADRIRAIEVLLDRMIGKPVDIQVTADLAGASSPHSGLAADILEALIRQMPPKPAATDVVDAEIVEPGDAEASEAEAGGLPVPSDDKPPDSQ